jgi:carboxyl-terminal processing protease
MDGLKQRSTHLATSALIAIVFVSGFVLGSQHSVGAQSPFAAPPGVEEQFRPFWQVYNLIQDNYVDPEGDELDQTKLIDGAIKGMVESLGDEFSGYMDAELFPVVNQELEGEIQGIGVVIRTIEDTNSVEVVSVMVGSPAERAGILAGDIFAVVDGVDVLQTTQTELANYVRGPEGSTVNITMLRGEELVDFEVQRERIIIPMIESEVLEDNIGYIRLNQFGPSARRDIDAALETMAPETLDGLIFDMRGNPGGLLSTAIDVGSAFIEEGPIVIEDFGGGREQVLNANGNFLNLDIPVVVLVDEASASASELIAGALQDNDLATIIGEVTFGKGTVQTWQPLVNGGGIRLTVARWLTPNGSWIHRNGITPDYIVEWNPTSAAEAADDIQLQAALDFLETGSIPVPSNFVQAEGEVADS